MKFPVRTVLCASDLSETGDGAVNLAYALAAPGGVVHLLHVNEPAFVTSPLDATAVFAAPVTEGQVQAAEERAKRHLMALAPAASANVTTEVHVVHEAGPAAVIAREAARLKADLVVLGTHGRGGIAKVLMGSVASDVAKRAKVPVVLYRAVR